VITAAVAGSLCAAAAGQAGTGGTISAGNCSFSVGDSPTDNTGAGSLTVDFRVDGPNGTDNVYQSWWWYRVNGIDAREYCLAGANASNWSGNTGTTDFTLSSFRARCTWQIAEMGANAGRVAATLAVTNTTTSPLDLTLFHYHDFDFGGNASGDTGVLDSPNTIVVRDPSAPAPFGSMLGYYQAENADAYQVAVWAVLRGRLTNTMVNNMDNTGTPFGPDDWTGGYQFNRVVPAGQTETVRVVFGIGPTIPAAGCIGDFNNSGTVTVQDIFDFLLAYFTQDSSADVNGQNGVTVQDIFDFLLSYFSGCP